MTESKSFNRVATIILTFLVIVTLLPIVLLVIASFTKEQVDWTTNTSEPRTVS